MHLYRELIDLINGNASQGILSVSDKIERGKKARDLLTEYKAAQSAQRQAESRWIFRECSAIRNSSTDYFRYFGYAFLGKPEEAVPNVKDIVLFFPPDGDAWILLYPGFCSWLWSFSTGALSLNTGGSYGFHYAQSFFRMLQEKWVGYLLK